MMFQDWIIKARQFAADLTRSVLAPAPSPSLPVRKLPPEVPNYARLRRVLLTDEVGRTLFEEYASHRDEERGDEETGWVLMGIRTRDEAVALATLPAGASADTSETHVLFNSEAQALASRIVRQKDRRLSMLGVVHTHPGTLRRPSSSDYNGDSKWVGQLRGKEGIFAIGTFEGDKQEPAGFAYQPRPHVQCWGQLRFTWFALGEGDSNYRALPVDLTHGPDVARALHPLWGVLEEHAPGLDRLVRQQAGVKFDVLQDEWGHALVLLIPLAERDDLLRVVLRPKQLRYFLQLKGEWFEVDQQDDRVDRGVYLLLAELADQA